MLTEHTNTVLRLCAFEVMVLLYATSSALPRAILSRGVATGVPPKSDQVDFLWSKNDVKTAIEHEY